MIAVTTEPSFDALIARLADKARTLAEAGIERDALALRGNPARWRRARLIWPLFVKG